MHPLEYAGTDGQVSSYFETHQTVVNLRPLGQLNKGLFKT